MAKIFFIEQEPSVNIFLREVLTKAGHQVTTAPLSQVLVRVQAEQPDVAVFNLSLWRTRSFQVVRNILASAAAATRVVVWPLSVEYVRQQLSDPSLFINSPQHAALLVQVQDLLARISAAVSTSRQDSAANADITIAIAQAEAAQEVAQYWLDDPTIARFVGKMNSLCMLEAAATFATNPAVLLRPSHLTLLGYSEREADEALFALARLGIIEPLEYEENPEFAVVATPEPQLLLAYFGTALRSLDFRRTVTLWLLSTRE